MNQEDVVLPPKRNEEDQLVDQLSSNAYDRILPNRYLSEGEEPEDLFERVAKNIAVAEAAHHDEVVSVYPSDVKPDHPRRHELVEEVWDGDGHELLEGGERITKELTPENASKFAYDTVIQRAPNDVAQQMREYADKWQDLMEGLGFIPNSPTLMNAGDDLQQLSACFVDSPEDDIDNIHETAREAAQVFQSGGGMGYAFWKLRPYGDEVGSTDGIASGPITFMRTYDQMCETIAQGGARRGAQMGIMRVSHPDVIQFIHAKNKDVSLANVLRLNDPDDPKHNSFTDALEEAREILDDYDGVPEMFRNAVEGHLSNFNISVGITDDFMDAVQNDEEFTFTNPRTGEAHIVTEETKELYDRFDLGEYVEVGEELSIPANEIWDDIVEGAHENGEPGVVYLERINKQHSFDVEEHPDHRILATNPCGEQPLEEYEACNLGHVNLSTVVSENGDYQDWRKFANGYDDVTGSQDLEAPVGKFLHEAIDWNELERRIELGTRFLENVVTMSDFPVEKIEEKVSEMRKIGLGIMGLAELLPQLGIRYGSDVGNEVARQLMRYINHESKHVSRELAEERGTFDEWEKSKWADPTSYPEWFEEQTGEPAEVWEDGYPIRNHNTTTIAPTGTTSMVANTTGGCEPMYSVANFKNVSGDVQGDEMLVQWNDYFFRVLEANDISVEEIKSEAKELMDNNEFEGLDSLDSIPDAITDLFVETADLSAKEHAEVQVACQEGVDSAISKTVNAPNDSTIDDAKEVFEYIYEHGGKGVTYYRDATRSKQVLTTRSKNKEFADEDDLLDAIRQRADEEEFRTEVGQILAEASEGTEERPPKELLDDLLDDPEIRSEIIDRVSVSEEDIPWHENGHYAQKRDRPGRLFGYTDRVDTGYGYVYVTVNLDEEGRPFELFANTGDSGGYANSFVEALGKSISVALRSGVNPMEIADELRNTRAPDVGFDDNYQRVWSIPDGIGKVLASAVEFDVKSLPQEAWQTTGQSPSAADGGVATETNDEATLEPGEDCYCEHPAEQNIIMSEGCKECETCGWSKC